MFNNLSNLIDELNHWRFLLHNPRIILSNQYLQQHPEHTGAVFDIDGDLYFIPLMLDDRHPNWDTRTDAFRIKGNCELAKEPTMVICTLHPSHDTEVYWELDQQHDAEVDDE